jgi:hypothetical protein
MQRIRLFCFRVLARSYRLRWETTREEWFFKLPFFFFFLNTYVHRCVHMHRLDLSRPCSVLFFLSSSYISFRLPVQTKESSKVLNSTHSQTNRSLCSFSFSFFLSLSVCLSVCCRSTRFVLNNLSIRMHLAHTSLSRWPQTTNEHLFNCSRRWVCLVVDNESTLSSCICSVDEMASMRVHHIDDEQTRY